MHHLLQSRETERKNNIKCKKKQNNDKYTINKLYMQPKLRQKKRESINFLEDFLTSAGGKQKKFDTIASSRG